MANLSRGVLYLDKDKFLLSIDNRLDVLSYVFPPNVVNNLDILDEEALKLNITEFIKKNGIAITNLLIVLSNSIIFEQDFKTEQESLIQEYLENVPFETISVKKIPIPGGTKVLVGNASFYTFLADIFKQNGTKLDYVIPEKALGANIGANFSSATARLILTQFESLSQNKFITDESTENKSEYKPHEKKVEAPKKNATLLYTIPVMGLLVVILGVMLLQPLFAKKKNTKLNSTTNIPTLSPKIPINTIPPTSSPSPQSRKPTSAQITYDPSSSAKTDLIKTSLANLGITNVQSLPTPSDLSNPIMTVSNEIDPAEKQKVFTEVQKILPSVVLQEGANQTVDIIITVGKTP